MKTLALGALLTCTIACNSFAQVNVLDANTIPVGLKENAHSIIRESNTTFEVRSVNEARLTVHKVITAFDVAGEGELFFMEYGDKFQSLEEAEIKVYNANGLLQKKYKKRELHSEAITSELVADGKIYYLKVSSPSFPVTVEYDYAIQYTSTLDYPSFEIQDPGQSVESSSFTAKVPLDLDLRFKANNIKLNPSNLVEGKMRIYNWNVKNLNAIAKEEGAVSYENRYPRIFLAPNKFDMDGNSGDLSSWKSFGEWYYNLLQGTSDLSVDTKKFLNSLIEGSADTREKVKRIYDYLQTNFRYVSIQLGIGGYKPFSANYVDDKKYGDCKALSNYVYACLSAVGIKSYPALINAVYNKEPVDPNFPRNSFNHMILCVPGKDTIWLECTSKSQDFAVLGSFTENKNALLITENGGVLVSTPKSKASFNTLKIKTVVKLDEEGSGETSSDISSTGEYRQQMLSALKDEKKDDQQKYLINYLAFPQPDEFNLTTNETLYAESHLTMKLEKIPSFTAGNKLFLNPRINKIWSSSLPITENRKQDYFFECPFSKMDSTVYNIPAGFSIESLPKSQSLKFSYGSFVTNYAYNEKLKIITTDARLTLTQNRIPFQAFQEARKFFNSVLAEYNEKIVVRKN